MKHLLRAVVAALLLSLLSPPGLAEAAPCPDPLPESELRKLDPDEDLGNYVMMRWLACGPQAALPVLPILRQRLREVAREQAAEEAADSKNDGQRVQADAGTQFEFLVIMALSINPGGLVDQLLGETQDVGREDPDATPSEREMARYLPLLRDRRQMLRHYEAGVQAGIDFLRRDMLAPQQEHLLELALVSQEVRQGRIDAARQHLARIAVASPSLSANDRDDADEGSDEAEFLRQRLQSLAAALAPVQAISRLPDAQPWVLDRSTGSMRRFRCGTAAMFEAMFGSAHLRDIVLRRADPDAAIAERLRGEWKSLIESPRADSDALLRELLRKRYTLAELGTGLDDAIASIRSHDGRAQLMLFGQALALPGRVLEGDASVAGGTRTRELSVPELAELVRAGDLYRRFGVAVAASAPAAGEG